MARYIDADVLIKDIKDLSNCPNGYSGTYDKACIIGLVEDVPTADVRENVKGKWINDGYDFPHGNDWIHCSVCGKRGINVPADLTNFCPNCGADMREENNKE